jgi:hypothetical protein
VINLKLRGKSGTNWTRCIHHKDCREGDDQSHHQGDGGLGDLHYIMHR